MDDYSTSSNSNFYDLAHNAVESASSGSGRTIFGGESQDAGMTPEKLDAFTTAARKYGVPADVLLGLAEKDSNFNEFNRSRGPGSKVRGIINVTDDEVSRGQDGNPYDTAQNVDAAARKLRAYMDAGMSVEEAVKAHAGGSDPSKWSPDVDAYAQDVMSRTARLANTYYPGQAPRVLETETQIDPSTGRPVPPSAEEVGRAFDIPVAEKSLAEDMGRQFKGGAIKGAGSIMEGAAQASDAIRHFSGLPEYRSMANAIADRWMESGKSIERGVSEETKKAIADSSPDGDISKPSTWTLGKNPSLTGYMALGLDVFGGMLPVVAAAVGGGVVGGAVVGGAQGGGAAAQGAREAITKMANTPADPNNPDGPKEIEQQSSYYRDLIAQGKTPEQALNLTRSAAERYAFLFTAPVSALGGAATSKILSPASKIVGGNAAAQIAGKAGMEAAEEGIQEVGEQVAQNVGTNTGAGTSIDPMQDTFGNFILGAIGGGGTGGSVGAATAGAEKFQDWRIARRSDRASGNVLSEGEGAVRDASSIPQSGGGEPTVTGSVTAAPPEMTDAAMKDIAAEAPGRQTAKDLQAVEAVPTKSATGRPGGEGPLSRILDQAAPHVAPLATAAGKRVTLTDENGSITGMVVSQDADGVLFKDDTGFEQLIDNGLITSGRVSLAPESAAPVPFENNQTPVGDTQQPLPVAGDTQAAAPPAMEPVLAPEAERQPGDSNLAEQAAAAVQPAPAPVERPLSDMSEEELRAKLKYIAEQGKVNGWSKPLTKERAKVEKAINALVAAPAAEPTPVAKNPLPEPLPEEPATGPKRADEATMKRLLNDYSMSAKAMQAKLDNYGLNDTHEVTQNDKGRFVIVPKGSANATQAPAPSATQEPSKQAVPVAAQAEAKYNPETKQASVGEWKFGLSVGDAIEVTRPDGETINFYDRDQRKHYGRRGEAYLDEASKNGVPEAVQPILRSYLKDKLTPEQFIARLNGAPEPAATNDDMSMKSEKIDTSAERVDDANTSDEPPAAAKPRRDAARRAAKKAKVVEQNAASKEDSPKSKPDQIAEDSSNAAQEGLKPEDNQQQHQNGNGGRQETEAGRSNSDVGRGQSQEAAGKKEVKNIPATLEEQMDELSKSAKEKSDVIKENQARFLASKGLAAKDIFGYTTDQQAALNKEYDAWFKKHGRKIVNGVVEPEHKDAGEPSETASQDVVNETVRKASNAEKVSPSQMRDYLVGEIDKALSNLPKPDSTIVTTKPHTSGGKVEFNGVKGTLGEAGYISVTVREHNRGWGIYAYNGGGKYGGKSELIYSFEASGPNAARKAAEALLDRAYIDEAGDTKIGDAKTVTFDVPGDGKFNVVNTVQALTAFRDRVMKSPGFKGKSAKSPAPAISKTTNQSEDVAAAPPAEETPEINEHGPVFRQYYHDAKGAIERLMKEKAGDAVAALYHPDVGDIDLTWGVPKIKKGYGLSKIALKHPEVLPDLQEFLLRLKKDDAASDAKRIVLKDEKGIAFVSLTWRDDKKTWLITAYEHAGDGTIFDTAATEPTDDTASRGTGADENIATSGEPGKAAEKPATFTIQDAGEKIGGARKDLARPSEPKEKRASTEKDDTPTWRKRYEIVEGSLGRSKDKFFVTDTKTGRALYPPKIFDTREEAERAIPLIAVSKKHRVLSDGDKFKITRDVTDRKRVTIKDGFNSRDEAMRYMVEHAAEIIETNTTFGEEILAKPETVSRTGDERRKGNVNEKDFLNTFGFRGVEFGNWNNQEERQEVVNAAYDGLMDLADLLGLPPAAISLDGDLALAFGARGHGLSGARAHYERDYGVINLTKMSGAGSLAHEWLHALDHYLGRQDGKASSKRVANSRGDMTFETKGREGDYVSHGFRYSSGVREELRKAYEAVMDTIYNKAEQYVEDTQKAARFLQDRRENLDRSLKQIRDDLAGQRRYGQRFTAPATEAQLAEFDRLAEQLLNGENLVTEHRYNKDGATAAKSRGAMSSRYSNDILDQISAILKKVRGTNGFTADRKGWLDGVRANMTAYKQRIDMMKSAEASDVKTKKVPTSYAMESKKIDQGRASDYWTTPHEMAARAFSAYVEDKVSEQGNQSDFLSFGSDNKFYVLDGIRPFPEGQERVEINKAFQNLVDTFKVREGKNGPDTALYSIKDEKPVAVLTGKELMDFKGPEDISLLRDVAGDWYNRNLRGTTATMADGEEVRFGKKGQRKTTTKNDVLLRAVPAIKAIIENGRVVLREPGEKGNVIERIVLTAPVSLDGRIENLAVSVHKTPDGHWHYDFTYDKDADTGAPGSYHGSDAKASLGAFSPSAGNLNLMFLEPTSNGMSPIGLRDTLTRGPDGQIIKAMLDSGKVVIEATGAGMPAGAQAATMPDGTIRLVASNLDASTARGVLLHEVFHSGAESLVGQGNWKGLLRRVQTAAENAKPGSWVAEAKARAEAAGTSPQHMAEEIAAYAIEDAENAPAGIREVADRLVGAVKAFVLRRFGKQFGAVTPGQLRALAVAALRSRTMASSVPAQLYSMDGNPTGFKVDNPGGRWLKEKQEDAYRGLTPTAKKGLRGSPTAFAGTGEESMFLPVSELAKLRGVNDENRVSGDFQYDDLAESVSKNGYTNENPVMVFVNHKGQAFINEGNTRIAVARDNNVQSIKAWVYWFNGAESAGGSWSPAKVAAMETKAVRYSIASNIRAAASNKDKSVLQRANDAAADFLTSAMVGGGARPGQFSSLALVPVRALFTELSKGMPAAGQYIDTKQQMDAFRNEMNTADDALLQDWLKWGRKNKAANSSLMDVMHESTLAQYDPSLTDKEAAAKGQDINPDIKAKYDALPKEAKDYFAKIRDAYAARAKQVEDQVVANVQKALELIVKNAKRAYDKEMERINDEGLVGTERSDAEKAAKDKLTMAQTRQARNKAARIKRMRQYFESNRIKGPYFPLARFGNYFVTLRDEEGKVLSFEKYASRFEQRARAEELRKDFGVDAVQESTAQYDTKEARNVDPGFLASIDTILDEANVDMAVRDAVYQTYLETMPDLSMRKARIHRKGTAGFEQDAVRGFAHNMFHSAHQLSRLRYGMDLQDHLSEAARQVRTSDDPIRTQAVYNEMVKSHEFTMNPEGSPLAHHVTSAVFLWTMAFNLSTAMVNTLQSVNVGIPNIAFDVDTSGKAGLRRAGKAMAQAAVDFVRGKGTVLDSSELTTDEQAAVRAAYDSGLIDSTQAHDLAGVAESGIDYRPGWQRFMRAASMPMHQTERFNREITFLAAYRVARQAGIDHAAAIKKAEAQTWATHFDNQSNAKPRFARGQAGKMLFALKSYQANFVYRIFRDLHQALKGQSKAERATALKRFTSMFLLTSAAAGVRGAFFYSTVMAIAGAFMGLAGRDDDDPDEIVRKWVIEHVPDAIIGHAVSGMMLDGIPGYLTGTSLTNRVGMQDMWFHTNDRDLNADAQWTEWTTQLLGAGAGIAHQAWKGIEDISKGNIERGIEKMLPTVARNVVKAGRYKWEGVQDKYGNPIVENVPWRDFFKQALGFTPAEIADRFARNTFENNMQERIQTKASDARKAVARAMMAGDTAAETKARAKVDSFNMAYPEYPILPKSIMQSMRNMERRSGRMDKGVDIEPKLRERIEGRTAPSIYSR